MMGFKDKTPIKTTNILAEDTWRTFLMFLIVLEVHERGIG